jgi:aquaporin Z
LLFGGLSAVFFDFGHGSPVATILPSTSARFFLTGLLFGSVGGVVAVSPLGRRSGAHLNPAVTFAFLITGHVQRGDLLGYAVAQCVGAIVGSICARLAWGSTASALRFGATVPTVTVWQALAIEAAMTFALIVVIMFMLARSSTMRFTPVAVAFTIGVLVWVGGPLTGTSLNPARSLGPDVAGLAWNNWWLYLVGPCAGASAAALLIRTLPEHMRPVTAKLFHDLRYKSIFRDAFTPPS